MQLGLVSVILILQVSFSLLGLGVQSLYLQRQDLPLSGQHQQLSLGPFILPGGMDETIKKKKIKEVTQLSCKCSAFRTAQ